MSSKNSNIFLQVEDLRKSFGGVRALKGLSFTVNSGMIKAIIGPNGAGKTTLFNVITGVFPPNTGSIAFEGMSIDGRKSGEIARLGVSRKTGRIRSF